MVVYLYRWKLKVGKEEQFARSWAYVTQELRSRCGSLGSRLHRGDDGLYYGYAQWPSLELREAAQLDNEEMRTARRLMQDATEKSFPEIVLEPIADYLVAPDSKVCLFRD